MTSSVMTQAVVESPLEQHQAEARRLARWAGVVLLLGLVPVVSWMALAPLSAAALAGQVALLRDQQAKVQQEAVALRAQIAQATESLKHQKAELETNRKLLKDGFIAETRISQLEATVADYGVKLEEKRSDLARTEQRLLEADLRIKSLEGDYRQQASDQLKVSAAKLAEIEQEQRKTVDASSRQVIVAPVTGDVINLKFTTPGSVISPREAIADIVPTDPRLVVEAHIRTEDITRVRQGQSADIRFTAFKFRTTR